MHANNITVCVPQAKEQPICDKNCEYCVSAMTGYSIHDYDLMTRNFSKLKRISTNAQTGCLLITGQGEPCLNFEGILQICSSFKDYPIEIQTNGIWLTKNLEAPAILRRVGIDIFAFSIDDMLFLDELGPVFEAIKSVNLTSRVCINVTDKLPEYYTFEKILSIVKRFPVQQLLFRKVTIPENIVNTKRSLSCQEWIQKHVPVAKYEILFSQAKFGNHKKSLIRKLPHGMEIADIDGVAVGFSDYCIQEYNRTDDIRSFIMKSNGHVYTSWDKESSRLF
jgi:hypothetical protein